MMIIQKCIIMFFAIIGFLYVINHIFSIILHVNNPCIKNAYSIFTVHNQENNIEDFVRTLMYKSSNKIDDPIPTTVFVDLGSSDKTLIILQKLSTQYTTLQVVAKEEYASFLQSILTQ